ncbi:MAG: S8 family peptidase [Bacteroidia bacterium]
MSSRFTFLFSIIFSITSFAQGTIDPYLTEKFSSENQNSFECLVFFRERVDFQSLANRFYFLNLPVNQRASEVIASLKSTASLSQSGLIDFIRAWNSVHPAEQAEVKNEFYVINALVVNANQGLIELIAQKEEVEFITSTSRFQIHGITPVQMIEASSRSVGGHEQGLEVIAAPFMWNLGYTGLNRRLFTVDTGVWPSHPAIQRQWLGNHLPQEQVWFGFDSEVPADKPDAHGTHVTGTVLGLDPATSDTIGVAFNAKFMAADPIVEDLADIKPITETLQSFQFALNPDGDDQTMDDIPDVICNSWGIGDSISAGLCTAPFIVDLYTALDLAGIAVEYSAGNNGPSAGSISLPQYVTLDSLNIFTVGALDGASPNYTIASFSSRGPTSCDVPDAWKIKPEVSAPGVNVRSSVQWNQYAMYSGTSMAGPHVAGAVLLLKEAFPFLSGREILNSLYQSAIDLGEEGEDNTYGRGLINLENAYNFLSQSHTPVPPNTSAYDIEISSFLNGEVTCSGLQSIDVLVKNIGSETILGGAQINFWLNGEAQQPVMFEDALAAGSSIVISLGNFDLLPGNHELYAALELNAELIERELINNKRAMKLTAVLSRSLPFGESLEYNDLNGNDLLLINPDYGNTWDTISTGGLSNSSYSARMRFITYGRKGQLDAIYAPALNIPQGIDSLIIKFDYAYRFRTASLSDSLKVEWSDNCGETWNIAFNKGGENLSTLDSSWTLFKPYASSHWAKFSTDISGNFNGDQLLVRFVAYNAGGSLLYLDNIAIYADEDPTSVLAINPLSLSIQPNPATTVLNITNKRNFQNATVSIFDVMGRLIYTGKPSDNSKSYSLSVSSFGKGIYFAQVQSEGKVSTEKFIVQ